MKQFLDYILEKKDTALDIKFTIWKSPDNKVKWLEDNEPYQKIEYVYSDDKEGIKIDFLLGFKDGTWQLWAGKNGSVSYYDDPYYNTKESKFSLGILSAVDKIKELINEVKSDKNNWVQYYISR